MRTRRRWVVVTGASSGIGAATVAMLQERGFLVIAAERRARRRPVPGVEAVRLDVTRQRSVDAAATGIRRLVRSDGLHGLVNAAGLALAAPLEWTTPAEFDALFAVNVVGVFRVTHALLPLLRRGAGRIVNVSSGAGLVTAPFTAAYSASKFALESLSDGLRMELSRVGVQVSVVQPGPVATPLWPRLEAQMRRTARATPAARRGPYARAWPAFRRELARQRRESVSARLVAEEIVDALSAERAAARPAPSADLLALRALPEHARDELLLAAWGLTGPEP